MALFVTYADQILKRNLFFIVSSTTVAGKKIGVLIQVSKSDTASFALAGFSRTSHFRHYWLALGYVQWERPKRRARILVL